MDVTKTMGRGLTIKCKCLAMPPQLVKSEMMPRSKMQPCDQVPLVDYVPLGTS